MIEETVVRSAAYLCISGIGVEHIREELARTGHARDDQSVDIKTIDDEEMGQTVVLALGIEGR